MNIDEKQCVAGCKAFTGGEIKHHSDCYYYPESMSKILDDCQEELKKEKVYKFLLECMMNPELGIVDDLALDIEDWFEIIDNMYSGKQETWCDCKCEGENFWFCHLCKIIRESRV